MVLSSDYELLTDAIREVARSQSSMAKLARAARTRSNIESEWIYEIDGTQVLEKIDTAREVNFGERRRADLRINHTLIEFKSTKPWYAVAENMNDTPPRKSSTQGWLGSDIHRMATCSGTVLRNGLVVTAGIFVLLVTTDGNVGTREFKGSTVAQVRATGLARYLEWLPTHANVEREGAVVSRVNAGKGSYYGQSAAHEALIVRWE